MKSFFAFKLPSVKNFILNLLIFVVIWVVIRFSVQIVFPNLDQGETIKNVKNAWLLAVLIIFAWRAREAKRSSLKDNIVPGIGYLLIGGALGGFFAGTGGETAIVLGNLIVAFYLLEFYRPKTN